MAKSRRGKFIVFEGIDGAGTTTQTRMAEDWLRGQGALAHATREPSTGPIGNVIRHALSGRLVAHQGVGRTAPVSPETVALLFAADRLDHLQSEIEPALAEGRHVICDRYVLSSLAYQAVDVDLKFVRAINAKAATPDVTFFLRVQPEVAMARIAERAGRDRFETLAFQKKVAARYDALIEAYREGRVVTLDGESPISDLAHRVRSTLEDLL
jgi:dTMP kinase